MYINLSTVFFPFKLFNSCSNLIKIHQKSVQKLNNEMVRSLLKFGVNAVGISPCITLPNVMAHGGNENGGIDDLIRSIMRALSVGLVPVIHGDAGYYGQFRSPVDDSTMMTMMDDTIRAGILGGDTLVEAIATHDTMRMLVPRRHSLTSLSPSSIIAPTSLSKLEKDVASLNDHNNHNDDNNDNNDSNINNYNNDNDNNDDNTIVPLSPLLSRVVFLTDVDGVYTSDPKRSVNANFLPCIDVDGNTGDVMTNLSASGSTHRHDVTGGLTVSFLRKNLALHAYMSILCVCCCSLLLFSRYV